MAIIFTKLADSVDMAGAAVEQSWQAAEPLSGVTVQRSYPLAETEAFIRADLAALFPANPVVNEDSLLPLKYRRSDDGSVVIVDFDGRPLLSFRRGADGAAELHAHDDVGNATAFAKGQMLTLNFAGVKTASANWIVPFKRSPSVTITLLAQSSQPPFKLSATKNGVAIKFQNAFTGQVEVHGVER